MTHGGQVEAPGRTGSPTTLDPSGVCRSRPHLATGNQSHFLAVEGQIKSQCMLRITPIAYTRPLHRYRSRSTRRAFTGDENITYEC